MAEYKCFLKDKECSPTCMARAPVEAPTCVLVELTKVTYASLAKVFVPHDRVTHPKSAAAPEIR